MPSMTRTLSDTRLRPWLEKAARELLSGRLSAHGLERVEIAAESEFDGEAALYFDAFYSLTPVPIDSRVNIEVQGALRSLLLAHGEDRFPYLRHHYAAGQAIGRGSKRPKVAAAE